MTEKMEEVVVELHGNTTYARCIGCGQAYDLPWVKARFDEDGAPDCTACSEPVKTATISFGQAMPEDEMRRATELVQHCDLMLAIGSSLVVWPAAGFPLMAKNCGAQLVIINNEPTEQDDVADLVIRFDIGETLGAVDAAPEVVTSDAPRGARRRPSGLGFLRLPPACRRTRP